MKNALRLSEVWKYIKSDFYRYTRSESNLKLLAYVIVGTTFTFNFWLRMCYAKNMVFYVIALFMRRKLARKYGLHIRPETKIGYGLYLGHGRDIVISPFAIIGDNCNLSQFTTIGQKGSEASEIGDNVYIGPSVCLVGRVEIGDNSVVGAGAVVTHSFPMNSVIAGVPAKRIKIKENKNMNGWNA